MARRLAVRLYWMWRNGWDYAEWVKFGSRRVSMTLRHILTEFSEFFHVSWTGLLIQASVGTTGGLGALRTKRSG